MSGKEDEYKDFKKRYVIKEDDITKTERKQLRFKHNKQLSKSLKK